MAESDDAILGTVVLKRPLKVGTETLTEVTLKEPTGGAMRAMGKGQNQEDKMLILLGCLAGLSTKTMDAMSMRDIAALTKIATSALGEFQETGTT